MCLTGVVYNSNNEVIGFYAANTGLYYPNADYKIYSIDQIKKALNPFENVSYVTMNPLKQKVWSNNIDGTGNKANNIIIGTDKAENVKLIDKTVYMDGDNTLDGFGGYNIILGKTGSDILIAGYNSNNSTSTENDDNNKSKDKDLNYLITTKENIEALLPNIYDSNNTSVFDGASEGLHDILDNSQVSSPHVLVQV